MRDNAPLAEQCGVDAPARSIYKPPVADRYRSAIEFTPSRASAFESLVTFAAAF